MSDTKNATVTCTCEGGLVITETESLTAARTGLDAEFVHALMDVWTDCADEVIGRRDS